jgi:hypothetical protein
MVLFDAYIRYFEFDLLTSTSNIYVPKIKIHCLLFSKNHLETMYFIKMGERVSNHVNKVNN